MILRDKKTLIALVGLGLSALVVFKQNQTQYLKSEEKSMDTQNAIKQKVSEQSSPLVQAVTTSKVEEVIEKPVIQKITLNKEILVEALNTLGEFKNLKLKVFKSEQEQHARSQMLKNKQVLQGLGNMLLAADTSSEDSTAAIDFLLEAYTDGDRDASWQSILAVLQDGQIENESLPLPFREKLAGNKGELMYHLSAIAPDSSAIIQANLAGPISEKIWQNVKSKQSENYKISYQEKLTHEQGR